MTVNIDSELRDLFNTLPKSIRNTVNWWIETDSAQSKNTLLEIAKLYRKEFRKALPGPRGKKAPSHVAVEIKEIRTAFERLHTVLTVDLSWEAREFLLGFRESYLIAPWADISRFGELSRIAGRPSPEAKHVELQEVISFLDSLPKPIKRSPPHAFLIRWIAFRLRNGKKPRSHALPIAGAIHEWATKEMHGEEWGESLLDIYWPKRSKGGLTLQTP